MNFTTDSQNHVTLLEAYFKTFVRYRENLMYTNDTLVDMSLEVLIELFRRTTESLVVSKINNEDPDTITLYQGILEQVKKAMIEKQATEHSHK